MNWIQMVSGPAVGAVIGYITNYVAVKMLFRPLHPVKLFGRTLPFTPGIIPKRRGALAHAVAGAIENSLLNKEDLGAMLASEEITSAIADGICGYAEALVEARTLEETAGELVGTERLERLLNSTRGALSDKIGQKLEAMDLGSEIGRVGQQAILDKVHGSMLGMFVNADMIASFTEPMAGKINDYVRGDGMKQIDQFLLDEINRMRALPSGDALHFDDAMRQKLRRKIADLYTAFIRDNAARLANGFRIADTVEEKINAMDVMELETLVLSVMKHELGMIINLGALLGLVLGAINIFI